VILEIIYTRHADRMLSDAVLLRRWK